MAADTAAQTVAVGENKVAEWKAEAIKYVVNHGPALFGALGIVVVSFLAGRWLGRLVMGWLEKKDMEPPVRMLIVRLIKLLVITFGLVMAMGTLGFNVMALVAGISVIGVGVSLATQGVLANLVAGLTIIFTKPFRVGQYIELLGVQGQVETIELFSTTLVHPDRSLVVVPNRKIVGEVLHNYGTLRQLSLSVNVSYATDLNAAMALVRDILAHNPRVLNDPTPGIGIKLLADSSIVLAVNPWTTVKDFGPAGGELNKAIVERFRDAGIEIPFPQREIRVLNAGAAQLAGVV